MKKRYVLMAALAAMVLLLAGCSCRHEWSQATCTEASRCRFCGVHRGSVSGHSFADATCEKPKTCTACGKTEGKALGHDWKDATCAKGEFCPQCGEVRSEALPHTWVDATCDRPKHCTVCGAEEGVALGHSWLEATCTTAKTCSICAKTEGEALGHSWTKVTCTKPQSCLLCGLWSTPALGHNWLEATCTEPVRCEYCEMTQGEALGHIWQPATPEKAKTCLTCGVEEGLPIELDDRFNPEVCAPLFGSWKYTLITPAEAVGVSGLDRDMVETITYTFGIYGTLEILTEADPECYKALQIARVVESIFDRLAAEQGLEGAAAEDYWLRTVRKSIQEYAAEVVEGGNWQAYMNYTDEMVYYCEGDALYLSGHWEDVFEGFVFLLEDDRLTISDEFTGEVVELTRVS